MFDDFDEKEGKWDDHYTEREARIHDEETEATVGCPGCLLILAAVIATTIAVTSFTNIDPFTVFISSIFLVAVPLLLLLGRLNTNRMKKSIEVLSVTIPKTVSGDGIPVDIELQTHRKLQLTELGYVFHAVKEIKHDFDDEDDKRLLFRKMGRIPYERKISSSEIMTERFWLPIDQNDLPNTYQNENETVYWQLILTPNFKQRGKSGGVMHTVTFAVSDVPPSLKDKF